MGFATESVMQAPVYSGITIDSTGTSNLFTTTSGPKLESGQAVFFTNIGITGVSGTTIYYLSSVSAGATTEFSLTKQYTASGGSGISTGTSGTMAMYVVPLTLGPRGSINKNYSVESPNFDLIGSPTHWLADSNGLVWSDIVTTGTTGSWTYTGNIGNIANFGGTNDTSAGGNGLIYFQSTLTNKVNPSANFDGWLFLWRQQQIDYLQVISGGSGIVSTSLSWNYNWGSYSLATSEIYGNADPLKYSYLSHEAVITPGNYVAFCDAYTMGLFYQESPTENAFDPTNGSTYAFYAGTTGQNGGAAGTTTGFFILANDDIAQCCAFTGSYLYIGGQKNIIYPWEASVSATTPTNPLISLPERDIKNIVGMNQNIYAFAGNRGRIYITNGSQAELFFKVPDHISTSVQPLLAWGAATYSLNQLYFGIFETTVPGSYPSTINNNNSYGGVWGIDVDSQVLYMQNTLSDGSAASYVCLLNPMNNSEMQGYGLYAGSYGTNTGSIVDKSIATPYTGGQTIIDFDLISLGTLNLPRTNTWVEYQLSTPLASGESISLYSRTVWNGSWSLIVTDSTAGNYVNSFASNWSNAQWLQLRAVLTSTRTTPSYVRLKQLRVGGNVGPSIYSEQLLTT